MKKGEILIKVHYAGVNRPDILQREGNYPVPKTASDIPGLEVSGIVVDREKSATKYPVGSKICALCHGGGYAEYVAVNQDHCLPIPKKINLEEAACIPETFITVWSNVFLRGGLKKNESVLIHGGSSGIGTTAVQLAKDAIANDKRFRIIPKDFNIIGDAKASTIDTEETETEEVKDIKTTDKVGLGDKDDYEVGLGQSLTGAVVSAGIKFPKGIINFGTLVYDAATGDGLDVDESVTERFNRAFDKTIFGIIESQAEEDARSTAAGHLTEAFLQIYNAAKVGTKVLGPGIQYANRKARELAPKLVKAVKTNRYGCLLYTSPSPRDRTRSRMPSSA